jgi:hypothetical protein
MTSKPGKVKWYVRNLLQAIQAGEVSLDGDGIIRIPRIRRNLLQAISPALEKNLGEHPCHPECVRYSIRETVLPFLQITGQAGELSEQVPVQ